MNNIKDLIRQASDYLKDKGIADFDIDSWLLAEYVFQITRAKIYLFPDMKMDESKEKKYFELIKKRSEHIPLQYLTGVQEFMGMEFSVNEHVLIPRQDTETLVEEVIRYINRKENIVKVLDMCTGSGCIGISIDKLCDNAQVEAVDISREALCVAKKNNRKLNANVSFILSDMFDNIDGRYDVIVSNPPYIETAEVEKLMSEVREHEPLIALDGTEDGLKFYKIICDNLQKHLSEDGAVFLEIGHNQGKTVPEILRQSGFYNINVIKDLSGNDRVIVAHRKKQKET